MESSETNAAGGANKSLANTKVKTWGIFVFFLLHAAPTPNYEVIKRVIKRYIDIIPQQRARASISINMSDNKNKWDGYEKCVSGFTRNVRNKLLPFYDEQ